MTAILSPPGEEFCFIKHVTWKGEKGDRTINGSLQQWERRETHPAANEEIWTGSTELTLLTRTFVTAHCYANRKHT